MQTGSATAHKSHEASAGELLLEAVVDDSAPVVAVAVVVFGGRFAGVVADGERMHFGFSEVAPPARNAVDSVAFVLAPEPFTSSGIAHIEHTGFAHPSGNIVHIPGSVGSEPSGIFSHVIVVDSAYLVEVGLRNNHCFHPFLLEVVEHSLVVWPLSGVPLKSTHVGFLTIPVEVEDDAIDGVALVDEGVDNPFGLLLSLVAILRCDVSEAPERREVLATGEESEILHDTR